MDSERDLIFLSYATEQSELCDWLARRLAAEGYAVWQDRMKMLGGENWPNDIDVAINNRTFRMLALLSRASMSKPNPQGEWLKGRAVGAQLGIDDFVIPLNTEGLKPHDITWNYQPITYIPFYPSWAKGLAALLAKLESIEAPRTLSNGRRLAAQSISSTPVVRGEPEQLVSNCFVIEQIPKYIRTYRAAARLSYSERRMLQRTWASRDVRASSILAFHDPPEDLIEKHGLQFVAQVPWCSADSIEGINARDLVVNLINRSLERILEANGAKYSQITRRWHLPNDASQTNRVNFVYPDGKKGYFARTGERNYRSSGRSETYLYSLSPSFSVIRDGGTPSVLVLRNHIYLTDAEGHALRGQKAVSRRKHLCKDWYNEQWSARTLGMAQFLADADLKIRFGPAGDQQLVINAMPVTVEAPKRVFDEAVDEPDEFYTSWQQDGSRATDDDEQHSWERRDE